VLQCVAVFFSVLQCVAVCCGVLQCVAVTCSVLQCVAMSAATHLSPNYSGGQQKHGGTPIRNGAIFYSSCRILPHLPCLDCSS